jgi:phosphate acetyltransferase
MLNLKEILETGAKKKEVRLVVCEGWDERCLEAASSVQDIVKITLLGNPKEIKNKAEELNLDISKTEIHDYKNSELKDELINVLLKARKHKGLTLEQAQKLIEDENYFGCVYCLAGHADTVAGSAIGSTAALMKPALQLLREKGKTVSEVSILNDVKNNRTLFGTDFSLNINPTPEALAQMAINAAECASELGVDPRVALLSFSTKGSGGDGPEIQHVRNAIKIIKEKSPALVVDGEMQADAAVNPEAAERKCPDAIIKGDANVLVFPNLVASNIFAHGMLQFSDMELAFTIIKGMAHPTAILGRSSPLETVKLMFLGCALQVNSK